MSKASLWSFAAISCCAFSLPAFSADLLDPIVVTATRTAQTVDQTLAAVTIITREDIQRLQAQSIQDVLSATPGINISNNGGAGQASSVFIRGTESDHVLVLVNGIKIGSATLGLTAFQNIPVDQIERIEIVRGPRSGLYGSEALGGVIQIFTKKGTEETSTHFSLGAGSFNAMKATAGLSGSHQALWYNVNLTHEDTDGFDTCQGNLTAGCFSDEPDDDGFDNTSGSIRLGSDIGNQGDWNLHFLHAAGTTEFDGSIFSGNSADNIQQVIGAEVNLSVSDAFQLGVKAGQSKDESDLFFNGASNSFFNTEKQNVSLQADLPMRKDDLLTIGIDYEKDSVDSSTAYEVTSRDNKGVFAQYLASFGSVDMALSLRADDNQQFGSHSSGGLTVSHVHHNGWRVTASAGTAYKAPTFNDLYFPSFGNPNLDPEESISYELGVNNGGVGGIRWSANLFQTEITELIAFDSVTFAIGNIDDARIRGLELEASTQLANWDIQANATLLDAVNDGNTANSGNLLPRRAKETLRLDFDRSFGEFKFGGSYIATGKRFDNLANSLNMGGYGTLDLRTEYRLNDQWNVQARIGNVFDKDYETAKFYNQAERNFFLTLNYHQ